MTLLVANARAASKQGWSATNGQAPEADDPPGVSEERKNKSGLCVLSTSGTSWVSKHGNKLFSCLKKHCKIHINNTKWYQTYVIQHQTHSYFFFTVFLPEPCCSRVNETVHLPLTDGPHYSPSCCSKSTPNRFSCVFFFRYLNSDARGKRRHMGATMPLAFFHDFFFFFFKHSSSFDHAIQIWTHANRKVRHCKKKCKRVFLHPDVKRSLVR